MWVHTALSFIGPYAHDFKVVGLLNSALKYADDFTLIVPENTDVGLSAEDEIRNVLLWSDDNKLSVKLSKCKEIVFRRPSVKLDILPAFVDVNKTYLILYYRTPPLLQQH